MKILMVCLGNICRSPLAEGILRDKLQKNGLENKITVDSAGTSNYHIGQTPDYRSTANAKKHGINISDLMGRQFTENDFDNFDMIFAMDSSNYDNIISLARNEKDKTKVDLFLNLNEPGKNRSVPDPYFGGEEGFENVFNLLDQACNFLIHELKQKV
jgi:protein-tyrosine phosphatase